jgi:hypothetical protein
LEVKIMRAKDRGLPSSISRRRFVMTSGAALAVAPIAAARAAEAAPPPASPTSSSPSRGKLAEVVGTEHWTMKVAGEAKVRLFLWRKRLRNAAAGEGRQGTILFGDGLVRAQGLRHLVRRLRGLRALGQGAADPR